MRNGLVGLNAQLRTRREWPSKSPTVEPESHLQMQNILKNIKGVKWLKKQDGSIFILTHACNYPILLR
jgi:hypothetical protein